MYFWETRVRGDAFVDPNGLHECLKALRRAMHVRPEGALSFRSCSHRLTVFVMSLIILNTIRIGRPVLTKKIAQSFADSFNTDPSPSEHEHQLRCKKQQQARLAKEKATGCCTRFGKQQRCQQNWKDGDERPKRQCLPGRSA